MSTFYYGFDDTKNDGSKLHGAEWDALTRILSSQLQGALKLHGPGIVAMPDVTSFEVAEGGAGEPFVIRKGAALIPHGVGVAWCFNNDETEIPLSALADGDQNFIHVAVQVALAIGAPDTRQSAAPVYAVSDQEVIEGHELLAQITFADDAILLINDRRRFSPALGHNPLLALLLGNGRITGLDASVLAPTFDDGTLNIKLPAGSQWIISGNFIQLESSLTIEAPAEANALWGVLSLDDSGLPTVLEENWVSVPPERGAGALGCVTTDTTQITAFTGVARDIIQTEAAKQQRFEALEARLALLESGDGEGGGSGGFAYVGSAPWLAAPDDARATRLVIAEMLDALRAELTEQIRNGGVRPQQTDLGKVISETAIVRQEVAKCQLFLRRISILLDLDLQVELGLERSQSANIVGIPGGTEIYGIGGQFPDHLGATTLTMNADGTVEP